MMINVNGRPVSTGASIDLLTRAVIISLFTWRRAGRDDAPRIFGWWGDTWPAVQNDRTGSRLYLLRRSKLTNKTPQLARDYVREALAWMVERSGGSPGICALGWRRGDAGIASGNADPA
ncbi:hypothetical protein EZW22_20355 [Shigella sonnei]|nr:hypothetical protein [Shigella sonnei]